MVSQLALLVCAAAPDFDDRDDGSEPDPEPGDSEVPFVPPPLPFDSDALFVAEPVDPDSEDPVDLDPASPVLDAVSFDPSDAGLSPDLSADEPSAAPARLSLR